MTNSPDKNAIMVAVCGMDIVIDPSQVSQQNAEKMIANLVKMAYSSTQNIIDVVDIDTVLQETPKPNIEYTKLSALPTLTAAFYVNKNAATGKSYSRYDVTQPKEFQAQIPKGYTGELPIKVGKYHGYVPHSVWKQVNTKGYRKFSLPANPDGSIKDSYLYYFNRLMDEKGKIIYDREKAVA